MKFTVSTKPLKVAANLAVINQNVSNFYQRSTLIQLTANATDLTVNTESKGIFSEVVLKGVGEGAEDGVLLDCLLFKQLVSTINTPQVTIEFTNNGITILAGKSTYALPKQMDIDEMKLTSPTKVEDNASAVDIDKNGWKFIKEHQLFARSTDKNNPVYMYVWTGDSDVLVGDYANSLFTYSSVGQLDNPCLLSQSIINLLASMPDDAKLISSGESYVVSVKSDSYEYTAQFDPLYESEDNGNYNADIILGMMTPESDNGVVVNGDEIIAALNQSLLLTTAKDHTIMFKVAKDGVRVTDTKVNCFVAPENEYSGDSFELKFSPTVLKSVISACPASIIKICPTIVEDEVVGITIIDDSLTVVLGGIDE